MPPLLLLFLLSLVLAGCASRPSRSTAGTTSDSVSPPKSYMRVAHPDADTVSLEIAVREFVPEESGGPRVWLVGASHVGESNYFAALQQRLDGCDRVLFEGVGARSGVRVESPDEGSVQHTLAVSLGLVFQLEAINYERPHFRNSDLTIPQLQELIRQGLSGEAGAEAQEEFEGLLQVMEGSSMLGTLVHAGLKLIGSSPKLREMTKLLLIETLGGVKGDLAQLRTLPPSFQRLLSVIIQERNKVVLRDLTSELRGPDRPRSIAIFYGAGHMADLEKRLRADLAYRPRAERWLTAISVNTRRAGLSPAEVELMHALVRWQLEALEPEPAAEK